MLVEDGCAVIYVTQIINDRILVSIVLRDPNLRAILIVVFTNRVPIAFICCHILHLLRQFGEIRDPMNLLNSHSPVFTTFPLKAIAFSFPTIIF